MRGAVQKPTKYWGTKQSQLGDEKSGNLSPSKQNWLGKNQELFVIGHESTVWGIALIIFIIAIWSNHYCGIRALGHWGCYIFLLFLLVAHCNELVVDILMDHLLGQFPHDHHRECYAQFHEY